MAKETTEPKALTAKQLAHYRALYAEYARLYRQAHIAENALKSYHAETQMDLVALAGEGVDWWGDGKVKPYERHTKAPGPL